MIPSSANTAVIQVVAGLGCRRGCNLEDLSTLLIDSLQAQGLTVDNLAGLASIAHKRDEPGLLALAEHFGLTLTCFSPEELLPYQHLVQACALTLAATGSPAVAEPCALALAERLGGQVAQLLGSKTRNASATCALASISAKDIA
ncbi:cobalamin biosynthesis protein [uncultured Pseudomonas sp.]|uniref:cobalamin biosynthesis protein n=1 Tax=uncultured Pseudomonas sp. TaxID=114707 RepID=UPI002607A03B|nr:cobalamin biosynthesis protein [uncultured Pseudomonas sp.]